MSSRFYYLLLLLFLKLSFCYAQQQNFVRDGIITLTDAQMFGFSNMTIATDKVSFINIANNTRISYPLAEVSLIEDDNQKVIYKGEALKPKPLPVTETPKDTLYRPEYPEGIYKTKEDFLNKTPSSTPVLRAKGLVGIEKPLLTTIEDACYFYDMEDKRIQKVFAVSYKGHLYFRIGAILENRNKTDRAQDSNFNNGFVRVLTGGDNYFYTEAGLANVWAQAASYGAAGGIAGAMGGGTASVPADPWRYNKGIVWDFKNNEFNIFKNCKDYNVFIKTVYPEGVQECDGQQPDMDEVRKVMEKIK